jgi:YD repeat-containing protein
MIPADAGQNLAGVYAFTKLYNFDGTLSGTTFPASKATPSEAVTYRYDALKRLTGVFGTNNSYVTDIKYTHAGLVSQAQLDTGGRKAWVTLGYETSTKRLQTLMLKRESFITPQNPTPDRPSSDVNQRYTYDDAGNVLSVADTPGSGDRDVQCFGYDYLGRMTDAYATGGQDCTDNTVGGVAPYHASYTYDEAGNRLTEKIAAVGGAMGTERTYDYPAPIGAQPHGVQKITEKDTAGNTRLYEYKYDKTGNTEKRTKAGEDQTLEWDAEGHLTSVTNADGKKTSFLYAADGSRLRAPSTYSAQVVGTLMPYLSKTSLL